MTCFVVLGTDTEIGKTITTAALAAVLVGAGRRVAIHKPAQTGMPSDQTEGDAAFAARFSGAASWSEGVRFREPLAPLRAAALEEAVVPPLATHVEAAEALAASYDDVILEGAGGLLVQLAEGADAGDLAMELAARGAVGAVEVVLTVRASLGTLNHTGLTVRELERRGVTVVRSPEGSRPDKRAVLRGLVIGSWPADPGLDARMNLGDLEEIAPLLGRLPAGLGASSPAQFQAEAAGFLPGFVSGVSARR